MGQLEEAQRTNQMIAPVASSEAQNADCVTHHRKQAQSMKILLELRQQHEKSGSLQRELQTIQQLKAFDKLLASELAPADTQRLWQREVSVLVALGDAAFANRELPQSKTYYRTAESLLGQDAREKLGILLKLREVMRATDQSGGSGSSEYRSLLEGIVQLDQRLQVLAAKDLIEIHEELVKGQAASPENHEKLAKSYQTIEALLISAKMEKSLSMARLYNRMAQLYQLQHDCDQSRLFYDKTLKLYDEHLLADSNNFLAYADFLQELTEFHQSQGDFTDKYYKIAVGIIEKKFGVKHSAIRSFIPGPASQTATFAVGLQTCCARTAAPPCARAGFGEGPPVHRPHWLILLSPTPPTRERVWSRAAYTGRWAQCSS